MTRKRFIYKLEQRHGKAFLGAIEDLQHQPFLTGSEIAERFGLTRERIRQICDAIYGKGFLTARRQELYPKKKLLKWIQIWQKSKDLKNQAYAVVVEKLQKMGLEPVFQGKIKLRLLRIKNNRLVKFKASTKVSRLNGHTYYVMRVNAPSVKKADILIVALHFQQKFLFFILPKEMFAHKSYLCINPKSPQPIYKPYLNKWDIFFDTNVKENNFIDKYNCRRPGYINANASLSCLNIKPKKEV